MHGAHRIGYEVYRRKHEARMEVEQKREEDHAQCQLIAAGVDRKIFS